jgi:hypothetical protein
VIKARSRCIKLRHRTAGVFGYFPPMQGTRATTVDSPIAKGPWSEIFRNGLGLYSALVIGGIAMNATQMLVIAIIMPTIVRDIGGASFYTWAAMLYTIGSIVGGASTGMAWSRLGARRAYGLDDAFAPKAAISARQSDPGRSAAYRCPDRNEQGRGPPALTSIEPKRLRQIVLRPDWRSTGRRSVRRQEACRSDRELRSAKQWDLPQTDAPNSWLPIAETYLSCSFVAARRP